MVDHGPAPAERHPSSGIQRTGVLQNFITRPTIVVGDYRYYDDPRGPGQFETNVLYHFDFIVDKLTSRRSNMRCDRSSNRCSLSQGANRRLSYSCTRDVENAPPAPTSLRTRQPWRQTREETNDEVHADDERAARDG
jgi:hypothetical protein